MGGFKGFRAADTSGGMWSDALCLETRQVAPEDIVDGRTLAVGGQPTTAGARETTGGATGRVLPAVVVVTCVNGRTVGRAVVAGLVAGRDGFLTSARVDDPALGGGRSPLGGGSLDVKPLNGRTGVGLSCFLRSFSVAYMQSCAFARSQRPSRGGRPADQPDAVVI